MVFKLVRTDCEEPRKILLPVGTHLIGRGKLLDCDDKRVSRNHGQLDISDDTIIIKALHQNPCFYTKKGTSETQILKQNLTLELCHGDKFGLLPNAFWFEILHCTLSDVNAREQTEEDNPQQMNVAQPQLSEALDQTQIQNGVTNGIGHRTTSDATETQVQESTEANQVDAFGDDDELINFDLNESVGNARVGSPSMIPRETVSPSIVDEDIAQPPTPQASHQSSPVQPSPSKRAHSPEQAGVDQDGMKRVKTEPVDVKQEPEDVKPGPSQLGAPNPDPVGAGNPNVQPTAPAGRERCWYGASCYRKNPQHKVQFSHPSDPDWGASSRVPCPYGRDCRKPDPRHWRDHDHPPEARQPSAQGFNRPAKRRAPQKRKKVDEEDEDSEEDSLVENPEDLIATGKRKRKPVKRQTYEGSDIESENEDPYQTDESDDWNPDSVKASQSSFDTQDF